MKIKYDAAELEVILFDTEDLIATSGMSNTTDTDGFDDYEDWFDTTASGGQSDPTVSADPTGPEDAGNSADPTDPTVSGGEADPTDPTVSGGETDPTDPTVPGGETDSTDPTTSGGLTNGGTGSGESVKWGDLFG